MYTAHLKIHGIVRLAVARPYLGILGFFDFKCITRTVVFPRLLDIFV
jgi:hypothetical protein